MGERINYLTGERINWHTNGTACSQLRFYCVYSEHRMSRHCHTSGLMRFRKHDTEFLPYDLDENFLTEKMVLFHCKITRAF